MARDIERLNHNEELKSQSREGDGNELQEEHLKQKTDEIAASKYYEATARRRKQRDKLKK